MSKYKKIMLQRGIMQKELLSEIKRIDGRVDNPLLSKIVNDICLPTPITFKAICKTLSCAPLDIYEPCEIELKERQQETETKRAVAVLTEGARRSRERRKRNNLYNLTVEIPRDVAERVFSPESLRKLGYLSKTDFVRQAVAELDKRLYNLNKK